MRIFKKLIAFVLALILVNSVATFVMEPVMFEHFLNKDIQTMKKNKQSVDLAFFGDSRAIRTFEPEVFEEELEGSIDGALNMGINQQHFSDTYYYMNDFLDKYPVKYAVVAINYDYFLTLNEESVVAKGLTLDRMSDLGNKRNYIKERYTARELPEIIKSFRYRYETASLWDNLMQKLKPAYWQYVDDREDIHYVSKGFATWDLAYKQGNTGMPVGCYQWFDDFIDDETFTYMKQIADLCKEKGVKLYFVSPPVTIGRIYSIANYEQFHQCIVKQCQELNVPFYNMNLLRNSEITTDDTNFADTEHVNNRGAQKASETLAQIIGVDIEGNSTDSFFYAGYNEMNDDKAQIGACDISIVDPASGDYVAENYAGKNIEKSQYVLQAMGSYYEEIVPEYQFRVSYDGGVTWELLQKYSTNNVITIEKSKCTQTTLFRVDARPQGIADLHHCYIERTLDDCT